MAVKSSLPHFASMRFTLGLGLRLFLEHRQSFLRSDSVGDISEDSCIYELLLSHR